MLEKYIEELESMELVGLENGDTRSSGLVELSAAKDILERFEVALINGLDCEELLKRQGWKISPENY